MLLFMILNTKKSPINISKQAPSNQPLFISSINNESKKNECRYFILELQIASINWGNK